MNSNNEKYPFRRAAFIMIVIAAMLSVVCICLGLAMPMPLRAAAALYMGVVGMAAGPMICFEYPEGYKRK